MFIEIIIEGIIANRLKINADLPVTFNQREYEARKELINSYINELKILYPNAYFQLAFESKIHLIEINN